MSASARGTPRAHTAAAAEGARVPTVLCWTPDETLARRLRDALAGSPWQMVEIAPTADAAALFLAALPDVLLLDCRADADAARTVRDDLSRLQGRDWRPAAALVAGGDEALARAVADGFDDVLVADAPPAHLRARLELLLRALGARRDLRVLSEASQLVATPLAVLDAQRPGLPVVWLNRAYEAAVGQRCESLLGLPLPGFGAPGLVRAAWSARRGSTECVRALLPRADRTSFQADVALAPVLDGAGRASHVVVSLRDATADLQARAAERERDALARRSEAHAAELRRARRDLDEHWRFTETLLDQLSTGVLTADGAAAVSFANRQALDLLGLRAGDCLGRGVPDVFGGSEAVARALASLAHGTETRTECTLAAAGGVPRDLGMTIIRSSSGVPPDLAFVLLFRDLGQRRQLEMELRRVERLNAIGIMVAGFAHEVRNPVAGIQALAEALLAESPPDDGRREYAERMLPLLARVERFVKASLRFGEPKPPARRRHDAVELMLGAREVLAAHWVERGAAPPSLDAPAQPILIEVDRGQIVETLLELIENALEAVDDPARVRLRVSVASDGTTPGRSVRFDVCDDGAGVAESDLPRVFDPFFTTKAKGTGLGLALAQTLARVNGGRLLVRSAPGVETVFSVVLPEARR